jgi:hypothetical protein
MKTLLLFTLIIVSLLPFKSIAQDGYKCSKWIPYGTNELESKLFLKTCENESGDSGSLEIKNETNNDVKLTYVINFNNGESSTGTVIIELDDKTPKINCLNCIETKGGGIKSWEFKDIIYRNSNGFENK